MTYIHDLAQVDDRALIGEDVTVWEHTKIREGVDIGSNVKIGRGVYIDKEVSIGKDCKIQNGAQIYGPCIIGDGVFIGPMAQVINDRLPRARGRDGGLADESEWRPKKSVIICEGASIGAGAIVFPELILGKHCMVGAGAVVRHNVEDSEVFTG